MNLEIRICNHSKCKRAFKVLQQSKQKTCSSLCDELQNGRYFNQRRRKTRLALLAKDFIL
jgi:predicted nucleic acid-binding Zn ribbon protein